MDASRHRCLREGLVALQRQSIFNFVLQWRHKDPPTSSSSPHFLSLTVLDIATSLWPLEAHMPPLITLFLPTRCSSTNRLSMIPDKVYELCHGTETVSSEMAKNPDQAPGDVWKKLYSKYESDTKHNIEKNQTTEITEEDLKRAYECGNWGPTHPSETFLKV